MGANSVHVVNAAIYHREQGVSLSLCVCLLLLLLLHVACNLIADCPHYGLARGNAHESGQQAAPQSFQALLSRNEGQSMPEATVLGRTV